MFICLGVPPRGTLLLYTSAVRLFFYLIVATALLARDLTFSCVLHQFSVRGTTRFGSGNAPGLNQAKARLDQYQSSLFFNSGSVYIWCGSSCSKTFAKKRTIVTGIMQSGDEINYNNNCAIEVRCRLRFFDILQTPSVYGSCTCLWIPFLRSKWKGVWIITTTTTIAYWIYYLYYRNN